MPVNIHATEKPLHKIFSDDYSFSIPSYQRPYAWTTEQVSELFTDLLSFLGNDSKDIDEINPYFLGSIVLIKKDGAPDSDVVDGQQRLTTLTILLSVMRTAINGKIASGLTKYLYEEGDDIVGRPNHYRLKLRERDELFFQENIQHEDGIDALFQFDNSQLSDTEKNIQNNAKYFKTALDSLSEVRRTRLLQYLMRRCYLVVVSTPDLDSAYRIFSVLNARGLDLGLTDLLKSSIIGALPEKLRKKYTDIWEDEEEDLGRDAFQDLFAHIRMIFRKSKLRETALNEFQKYVLPLQEPQKFIDSVVKPYSDALEIIKAESYQSDKGAEAINSLFKWLNQIDNFDWIPPAILFLSQNQHSPDKLKEFFSSLERLAAGMMIIRTDINYRIDRYGRILTAIENGDDFYADDSPLQLTKEEQVSIVRTLHGELYEMKRIRKFVLLRLDSALSQGEATYDYPVISVEHVLPQNPPAGSKWLEWFPDEDKRRQYVHRIGNMALLSRRKNSEAQNFEFEKKKQKYFAMDKGVSPFALTTQVLQKTEWTPEIVEERETELVKCLRKLWRLGVVDGQLIRMRSKFPKEIS
ncbi:MAG: DUF262 domain-containing HNH endonuclease family protein [Proteobacteria bacterium]|nr:DUF262 domain-containing HNH endonuclease family protein [Pseudomonadota bacterium]